VMPLLFHLTTPPWDGVLSDGGADACDARADAVLRAASCAAAAAIVARLDCQTVVDLSTPRIWPSGSAQEDLAPLPCR
jgi:hypothetical protein